MKTYTVTVEDEIVNWLTNGEGVIPMNKIDQYNDRNRY